MSSICESGNCAFGNIYVPGSGPIPAPLLLVGENPGAQEVSKMRPFVGPAGQKLRDFMQKAGIDPSICHFTNTVHCRDESRDRKTPEPAEIDACLNILMETIKVVRPQVVVALGNTALGHFYPGMKVGRIRGTLRMYPVEEGFDVIVIPTYHPSAVLHGNTQIIPMIIQDLKRANDLLRL